MFIKQVLGLLDYKMHHDPTLTVDFPASDGPKISCNVSVTDVRKYGGGRQISAVSD